MAHKLRFRKKHRPLRTDSRSGAVAPRPTGRVSKSAIGARRGTKLSSGRAPHKCVCTPTDVTSRKRASAEKGFRGRNVLDINILRLLGVKLPSMAGLDEPPGDVGHFYGLSDESGRRTFVLNEDVEGKLAPASPSYQVFSSAEEARAYAKKAPGKTRTIFTDGSYFPRTGQTGYAVWWGPDHPNNAAGPVPPKLPLSSARAEEYAIFLALLQIKLEAQTSGHKYKYEILTDSTWTIGYISKWFRKWDKAKSSVGWKTPPSRSTSQRDVLRVSAGILWELRFSGIIVQFAYVPGHEGIEGNEMANSMCRHAARTGDTVGPRPIAF